MTQTANGAGDLFAILRYLESATARNAPESDTIGQLRSRFALEGIICIARLIELQQLVPSDEQGVVSDIRVSAGRVLDLVRDGFSKDEVEAEFQETIEWTGHLLSQVDPELGNFFYRISPAWIET